MTLAELWVQQLLNAVSIGSMYALLAIGLAMVFGILRLINFAHGDLLMVGAYVLIYAVAAGIPFWVAFLLSVAAAALLGVLMERLAYRPVRGQHEVVLLLTSFGVTMLLENSAILAFSPRTRPFPLPEALSGVYHVGHVVMSGIDLAALASALVLLVGLNLVVTRTKLGVSMRAAAEDLTAAHLVGIHLDRVVLAAFAIGSALAGVAGLLWAAKSGRVEPLMGFTPVLKAFVATVIGGLGSIGGAVLGGYLLGLAEVALQAVLPPGLTGYRDGFVFILLILVLLVRPHGLLGKAEGDRV
ncbi:MAG: branched-chain amino acid ABC transporter permease [Firmicutes bacterium]|nr:branched-chain amino acid ABC transporter permease [Bacillota bacterium]